jgi:putative flippase GtrA
MMAALRQVARFSGVGILNTLIGLAVIYGLMYFLGAGPALANAIGYAIGLIVSFWLNRDWTFESSHPLSHSLPRYLLVSGISYLLNLTAVLVAITHFSANPYLSQMLGIGIYSTCVFFGCRWFAFAPTRAA